MTGHLSDLRQRISSMEQLGTVVSVLRSTSAARAQAGRALLPGIRAYADVVGSAIAQAMRIMGEAAQPPSGKVRRIAVLFCAEQSFAASLSRRVMEAAAQEDATELLLAGSRGMQLAEERGIQLAWWTQAALHPDSLTAVADRIADALYVRLQQGDPAHVTLLIPVWSAGSGLQVERRLLLPLDPSRFTVKEGGEPPLTSLPPALLLPSLVEEYVLALLCEAAALGFVAEQEARLNSMASAKRNTERMLDGLRGRARRLQQEDITAELIELAAGARPALLTP